MEELPIGRRVAYWRNRRKLTLQVLADRVGMSKSWVEKVESGARRLDKFSTISEVADALEIDISMLLGRSPDARPPRAYADHCEIGALRDALGRSALASRLSHPRWPDLGKLRQATEHAWTSFQYARYDVLAPALPALLRAAQSAADHHTGDAAEQATGLLAQVNQVASSTLRKLGEYDLAHLAADRALGASVRCGDDLLAGTSTTRVANALLGMGHARAAFEANVAMAHRLAPGDVNDTSPDRLSVYGALLLQGAMAAAHLRDSTSVGELIAEARVAATALGGVDVDHYRTSFGPTNVELHRAAAAVELGEGRQAIAAHDQLDRGRLSALVPERRAQHLLDLARALAHTGKLDRAGEVLGEAEHLAPMEIRSRPAAHAVMTGILRRTKGSPPALLASLADRMGARV
ncbi:helix-turn-helix domain-containing protein [Micromonospora sp. NPDC004704]